MCCSVNDVDDLEAYNWCVKKLSNLLSPANPSFRDVTREHLKDLEELPFKFREPESAESEDFVRDACDIFELDAEMVDLRMMNALKLKLRGFSRVFSEQILTVASPAVSPASPSSTTTTITTTNEQHQNDIPTSVSKENTWDELSTSNESMLPISHSSSSSQMEQLLKDSGFRTIPANLASLDDISSETMMTISSMMVDKEEGVSVKDRRWHGRKYKECFVGDDLVSWFLHNRIVFSRETGKKLGLLFQYYGLFDHVTSSNFFKDAHLFYRFEPLEEFRSLIGARAILRGILDHPRELKVFSDFLETKDDIPSFLFYEDVTKFERMVLDVRSPLSKNTILQEAERIFNKYLAQNSIRHVNLPLNVEKHVQEFFAKISVAGKNAVSSNTAAAAAATSVLAGDHPSLFLEAKIEILKRLASLLLGAFSGNLEQVGMLTRNHSSTELSSFAHEGGKQTFRLSISESNDNISAITVPQGMSTLTFFPDVIAKSVTGSSTYLIDPATQATLTTLSSRVLQAMVDWMVDDEHGIRIKDRRWFGRKFKQCFVAEDLVTWFINQQICSNREDATYLGLFLYRHSLIEHVTKGHRFRDLYLFFRMNDFKFWNQFLETKTRLEEVLKDSDMLKKFSAFCAREFAEENLNFYLDVEEFVRIDPREEERIVVEGIRIYREYILPSSRSEVNLPSFITKDLAKIFEKTMKKYDQYKSGTKSVSLPALVNHEEVFADAEESIYRILEEDVYARYLNNKSLHATRSMNLTHLPQKEKSSSIVTLPSDLDLP